MLILLALPVVVTVAAVHRYLQHFAPTNLLVGRVRAQECRWRTVIMLAGLTVGLLLVMQAVTVALASGAPGWLNLGVFLLAWDALKVAWLAVGVMIGALSAQRSRTSYGGPLSIPLKLRSCSWAVTEDLSLFGDDPAPQTVEPPRAVPIADWQVDLLRNALEARGLTSMAERRQVIESAAGRSVASLRSLTHDEGMQVLSRLGEQQSSGRSATSQWDDRDEDTWIDRL